MIFCPRCVMQHSIYLDKNICEVIYRLKKEFSETLIAIQREYTERLDSNSTAIKDLQTQKLDKNDLAIHPFILKQMDDKNLRITQLEKQVSRRDEHIERLEKEIQHLTIKNTDLTVALNRWQTGEIKVLNTNMCHKGIEL